MYAGQYEPLMKLLTEIRDRLPVPALPPFVTEETAPGVITLPEEPPVGTRLEDTDGDEWKRYTRGWLVNGLGPDEPWSTVLKFAPLTIVSAPDQPAAKSTDAILADVRAMVNDWKESRSSIVQECADHILNILDGK